MKKALTAFAGIVFTGVLEGQAIRDAVTTAPVQASKRLQLTISVEQRSVKLGEPVVLHARYKNVSSKPIFLGIDWADFSWTWERGYALTINDASGAEPARTALGERWLRVQRAPAGGSSVTPPPSLEPGAQGKELVIDLAMYYQLTQPGTYLVRVVFRGPILPEGMDFALPIIGAPPKSPPPEYHYSPPEEAVSNEVQVTITP